ncbi:MAG: hypothetical protein AAGD00_09925 [Planctomycetota bacterium]
MPRLRRIASGALEEIAEQQRFAPKRAVLRHLERIERFACDIDPDALLDERAVIERITGYRQSMDEPAMLVAAAVLADLSALAERLCHEHGITLDDLDPGFLRIEELARRWNVSRKTIDRYRSRGLIARRVRDDDGNVALAFTADAIERFEQAHKETLVRAGSFERMSDEARSTALDRARASLREGDASLNAVAKELARKTGRSPVALRTMIERDDAQRDIPLLSKRSRMGAHERVLAARAQRFGVRPALLTKRLDRSHASVNRLARDQRLAWAQELLAGLPDAPADAGADTEPAPPRDLRAHADATCAEWAQRARATPTIDRAQESAMLARYRAACARARREAPIDVVTTELRAARLWLAELVSLHHGTILRTLEQRLGAFDDLRGRDQSRSHRASLEAAVGVARGFDPARGGRLAAPMGLAVNRAIAQLGISPSAGTARAKAPARANDWTRGLLHPSPIARVLLDPSERLLARWGRMDERERALIDAKYGLHGERPHADAELRARFGTSSAGLASVRRSILERRPDDPLG